MLLANLTFYFFANAPTDITIALNGVQTGSALGTLVSEANVRLIGVQTGGELGILSQGNRTVEITGVQTTGTLGNLTASEDVSVEHGGWSRSSSTSHSRKKRRPPPQQEIVIGLTGVYTATYTERLSVQRGVYLESTVAHVWTEHLAVINRSPITGVRATTEIGWLTAERQRKSTVEEMNQFILQLEAMGEL